MKSLIFLAAFVVVVAATEKGGGDDYGYPVSYAPVYHAKAVDSYAYKLPQYKSDYNFKTYMPVMKYVAVKSVPYYGPTMAFYPSSYGGGYKMGGGGGYKMGGGGGYGGGGYGGGMMGGYGY